MGNSLQMSSRTSIELHPTGCRLVEVDLPTGRRHAATADVRVKTYATTLPGAEDAEGLAAALTASREQRKLPKRTWVTIWGLRSIQQLHRLPPANLAALEALATRESKKDLIPFEANGDRACIGITAGSEIQVGSHRRREVSLVAASAGEITRRIQPLVDAGFVVEGVSTPALALASVARAERDMNPGSAAAYVALSERMTCLAIIRDGVLLFSREMSWGHGADASAAGQETIGNRLTSELKRSVLYFKQTFRASVDAVILCGDMSNLRDLTGPLGVALGVPVKTLDSLVGIDAVHLPPPVEEFRAQVAALRLAIATGAESAPAANLLPATIRVSRAARAQVVRVGAAFAASVLLVLFGYTTVQRSASAASAERAEVQAEIARLEPEAQRLESLRQVLQLDIARRAALRAFDSQGPRLARVLEALAASTPPEITLTTVAAEGAGLHWTTRVEGVAITEDASSGQAAVNAMIDSLAASPYVGTAVEPPSLRVLSGGQSNPGANAENAMRIPAGMSGVEFMMHFEVRK